jgi:ribonuclease Z
MEKINVAGVTLQGYAQGGWQTSIYCPEVKAVFDAGVPLRGVNVDHYFITHSHPDHIMALPYIVGKRALSDQRRKMLIHVPKRIEDLTRTVLLGCCRLFGDRSPDDFVDIIGVKPGDEVPLIKGHSVKVLETMHRGPSVGYVVMQQSRKLKPEYQGIEGRELGRLRKEGVEITDERVFPMLAVPGDTKIEFLLEHELARKAKVLVHEVTVWDEESNSVEGCRRYGHTHVAEMIEHCSKFEGEALVLCHRSMRWTRREVEQIFKRRFPAAMLEKMHLFDGGDRQSFGAATA